MTAQTTSVDVKEKSSLQRYQHSVRPATVTNSNGLELPGLLTTSFPCSRTP